MCLSISKSRLRKYFLKERKNNNSNYIEENLLINQQLKELILSFGLEKNAKIAIYLPLKGEVNLDKILTDLSYKFAAPKIEKEKLYFVPYQLTTPIEKTNFKQLKQPIASSKLEPDIFVIPALALDLAGSRLGYGGGFYDKYFSQGAHRQEKLKIGVCFHQYLVAFLPKEVHDLKLNYIITEKIIIKL